MIIDNKFCLTKESFYLKLDLIVEFAIKALRRSLLGYNRVVSGTFRLNHSKSIDMIIVVSLLANFSGQHFWAALNQTTKPSYACLNP